MTGSRRTAGIGEQIPRTSLALLMVAQVAVVAPLAGDISLWIVGVCLFCGFWRTQVHLGRWGYPPAWIKLILVCASVLGLAFSGYRTFTLEAATSLLVLAFALKLIEMRNQRDAYLVIYLCYFLTATAFLFDQSIAMAVYQAVAVIVATAALVGLNQLQSRVRPLASFWTATGLVVQALPLTLVLFMLFPRIGPLWSVPMPTTATTGMSDRITPGDVATLSQSDELAFRVSFESDIPPNRELYWRGLIYSHYENGTWSVGPPLPVVAKDVSQPVDTEYQVFLQPTQSRWLYALGKPGDYSPKIAMLRDYRLISREPVRSVLRYRVESDLNPRLDLELPSLLRRRELTLPAGENPRLRAYAAELVALYEDPRDIVQALMRELEGDFVYTLSPPALPDTDGIDALWFDTRAGFCSHFAGAVVFALRAAGIPARMVGGYQGGEINPVTGHLVVRQYLAHAWVEYWVDGQGWIRVDPTSAVAPERIDSGLSAALSGDERSALSFLTSARMGGGALLTDLLQWADSLEHQWNLWVVGYDADTQSSVLQDLLGTVTPAKIGIAITSGGALSLFLVSMALLWRRPKGRHPAARAYSNFCVRMERLGYNRQPAETPAHYLERLSRYARLEAVQDATLVQRALFDPDASRQTMRALQKWLRRLQLNLFFAHRRKTT